MKHGVKKDVLEFMQNEKTNNLSSNKFILKFSEFMNQDIKELLTTGPSIESITRTRRYVIKAHGIGERTNADTEEEYIEEFALKNKS